MAELSSVEKFTFSSETASATTALGAALNSGAGMSNNGTAGYLAGGALSGGLTPVDTNQKYAYSDDTRSAATALSTNRDKAGGMSDSGVSGYVVAGGYGSLGATYLSSTDKYDFSDDTRSAGTALSSARRQQFAMSDSGVAGYQAGGYDDNPMSSADTFAWPSDTRSAITALSTARYAPGGISDAGGLA